VSPDAEKRDFSGKRRGEEMEGELLVLGGVKAEMLLDPVEPDVMAVNGNSDFVQAVTDNAHVIAQRFDFIAQRYLTTSQGGNLRPHLALFDTHSGNRSLDFAQDGDDDVGCLLSHEPIYRTLLIIASGNSMEIAETIMDASLCKLRIRRARL
jgi:hypothetical protein